MARLKSKISKILLTADFIEDEKISIEENLNQILDQVLAKVNYLKANSENIKHRNVSHIQKYILEVYQQFCQINSVLDVLLEENTLMTLDVSSVYNELDSSTQSKQVIVNSPIDELRQIFTPELPGATEKEDGGDIQNLKKSLSEFSEKLGLNKQNLSDMKDYYEKASTSFQTNTPESISMPGSSSAQTSQLSKRDVFEVPEKDINTKLERFSLSDNIDNSELTDRMVKLEHTDSTSPTFSISDNDIDSVTKELLPENLHKCTALEKLNNFKSKVIKNPGSLVSFPDIKLKPSATVINNVIPHSQNKTKKCKKQDNIHYEINLKDTPKVEEECIICHTESPDEFYIHVVDTITISIDKVSQEVNSYCRRVELVNYASKEETLTKMGRFCLALIDQCESWYRVEILKNHEKEDVLVRLVDYGNKTLVSYKNLLKLTEELSSVPMLAIQCHFPWLYPPGSTRFHKLTTWPLLTIETLNNLYESIQHFKIVYALREENNSVAIDLACTDKNEDTIGQLLIDEGFAVQIVDEYDENNGELEMFLQDIDVVEVDNINEAILGYDPRDEARICRFTKPDGTCYKGKHCKLEHIPLPKDGFTTDKEAVYSEAMYPLILPPIDTTVMILITGYIDTCKFFGQIIQNPYNQGKYTLDHDLYLLQKEMNSTNIVKTYESFKISPALGEIVIAYHYKNWSRAIVREVKPDEMGNVMEVKLFILDSGETITAPMRGIRKIKPHFLKLPFQCIEFYIYNYRMKKNCSAEKARQFFFENLYLRNFIATTKSSYSPLKVELTNLNGCMLVGDKLEQEGYAERSLMDIHISETCSLDLC